jgi:Fe-S cluster biogenesis protein NfuA
MARQLSALEQRLQQIETLVGQLEQGTDPTVQMAAREMVRAVLDLHAAGLARVLELVSQSGDGGRGVLEACAQDELVSHLLLLHGLHPEGFETRVCRALQSVRPFLESHGGNVELLGLDEGLVRLRMVGTCNGCPSSNLTMKARIERAIYEAAPDAAGIEVVENEAEEDGQPHEWEGAERLGANPVCPT